MKCLPKHGAFVDLPKGLVLRKHLHSITRRPAQPLSVDNRERSPSARRPFGQFCENPTKELHREGPIDEKHVIVGSRTIIQDISLDYLDARPVGLWQPAARHVFSRDRAQLRSELDSRHFFEAIFGGQNAGAAKTTPQIGEVQRPG